MSQPNRDQAESLVSGGEIQGKKLGALVVSSFIFELVIGWITVFNAIINSIIRTSDWFAAMLFGAEGVEGIEFGIPITQDGLVVEVFRIPANTMRVAWDAASGFFPIAGPFDFALGVLVVALFYLLVEYLIKFISLVVRD